MAELNFNALTPQGPRGFMQGFTQGQTEQVAMEANQLKLQELKRDRDEMMQLQEQLKGMGQDPDLDKFLDVLIATGRPEYVETGVKGKQKLKEQRAYANLIGGAVPSAPAAAMAQPAPAATAAAAAAPAAAPFADLGTGMYGMAPANALARPAPVAAAPVNALAQPAVAGTRKRINDLMTFAAQNPSMANQAMAQAQLLQDQLEMDSRRGPATPALPAAIQEFQAYQNMTPEEKAAYIRHRGELQPKPATSQVNIKLPEQEKEERGARGKLLVKQYEGVADAAKLAARTLPALETQERILDSGFKTGFGTDAQKAGASVLAALGVPEAGKFATDAQTFLAATQQAVLQRQLEQKGPQTEADAQRVTQTGAQLGNTPDANKFIVSVAKAQLKRDIAQRNFYDKWWRENKTYDGAEDAWFSGEGSKSLFDYPELKKYAAPAAAAAASPSSTKASPYADAEKERRYQEWKRKQGQP